MSKLNSSFTNALVSVSDKTGLIEFLRPLVANGLRIVSTGGTSTHLKEAGFSVVDVSEQTSFAEVMDGRVKTLHPKVHMALLARAGHAGDAATLKQNSIEPFDLVIGNLYPFEVALKKGYQGAELIEYIDVGGPSFLRAAAKNFASVAVVCDPNDYSWIGESKGDLALEQRQHLAAKVFAHTAGYDAMIAEAILPNFNSLLLAPEVSFGGAKVAELRYGENPQQKAVWLRKKGELDGLHCAEIIQGKPLSYNNILDLHAAANLALQFSDQGVAVAVKHNNPCGVGVAPDTRAADCAVQALALCLKADPVSVFGGIIAMNQTVDESCAELLGTQFLECVLAPNITEGAKLVLKKKKNLRVLIWPILAREKQKFYQPSKVEVKSVLGGYLLQDVDTIHAWQPEWKVLGEQPSESIKNSLSLAWKVVSALKSNAIAICGGGQTLGLGMGQVNRVDAVAHALERMQKHHEGSSPKVESVLASDAFFPFPDSVQLIAEAGIRWVIQPGGSVNDESVFAEAKKQRINIVITGTRHFRH